MESDSNTKTKLRLTSQQVDDHIQMILTNKKNSLQSVKAIQLEYDMLISRLNEFKDINKRLMRLMSLDTAPYPIDAILTEAEQIKKKLQQAKAHYDSLPHYIHGDDYELIAG